MLVPLVRSTTSMALSVWLSTEAVEVVVGGIEGVREAGEAGEARGPVVVVGVEVVGIAEGVGEVDVVIGVVGDAVVLVKDMLIPVGGAFKSNNSSSLPSSLRKFSCVSMFNLISVVSPSLISLSLSILVNVFALPVTQG